MKRMAIPRGMEMAASANDMPQCAGTRPVVLMKGPPNSTSTACKIASVATMEKKSADPLHFQIFQSSVNERALSLLKICKKRG